MDEEEIYAKNNSLIVHGILRNAKEVDGRVILKIEMWNNNNNQYSIEEISFPSTLLVGNFNPLSFKFEDSFPIVDISINFNWAAYKNFQKMKNFLNGQEEKFIAIKSIEIVNKIQELTDVITKNPQYISGTLRELLLESYDVNNPATESNAELSLSNYLSITPQAKKSISPINLAFLRNAVGLVPNYILPENCWRDTISNTQWDWEKHTSLKDYLSVQQLDIDSSRNIWNNKDIHYKATDKLGYVRRLSEYLWFASNYYLANSFDCGKDENMTVCNELVNLYIYNKSYLYDYNLRGGYGVCSATYMLPELVKLTNNESLKGDLQLIAENNEKIYNSCTFIGGGKGLCARDLKESVNCGLLLAYTDNVNLSTNFILDRYAFFDQMIYNNKIVYPLSSKNSIYSEIDVPDGEKAAYISRYMEYIKFLTVVNKMHL